MPNPRGVPACPRQASRAPPADTMKQKAIPPITLTAGQRARLTFNITVPDGTAIPTLIGALTVRNQRVDMTTDGSSALIIPPLPPGVHLAEVRAGGTCILYGHIEVLPSPLADAEGERDFIVDVDLTTDVLTVNITMAEGLPGSPGNDGASAYAIAVRAGFTGTEEEWLASLKGEPGTPGTPGADGSSAYQIWLDDGNSGTEADFLASLVGPTGPQGEPGTPGGQGEIVYVTGATIPNPASVATGDEIVFTVTSDFDLAEAFAALSGQMSIGWTIRNTGSSDIVIYNGNDAIARIGASSFVRGSALIDATGSGISVFKPALGQEGYINLSADGKILTVRQPDDFAVTPVYTGTALGGNTRAWAYNISPNITHIDGGGVLIAPQGSNRLLAFMTYLKSVTGVDYSQVIDADYMFALSGMESFDVCFPRATTAFGLFNSCQKLHTVRLIVPLTADLRECFYATSAPRHVTLHAGQCTILNFAEGFAKGDIGAIRNVENLEFEDYDGTSALASCTTFKLYAYHTKLTNQAISNCVGALPDWSLTGKSATCQFPAGRLTEEQKGILTAKGWAYTEI